MTSRTTIHARASTVPAKGPNEDLKDGSKVISKDAPKENPKADPKEKMGADEASYRRLVELSPMPVAVHNKGIIVYMNKAATKLMGGKNADEFLGKNVMQYVHPDSQEIVRKRVALLYQEGKQHTDVIEEKLIRADGKIIHVEIASLLFQYNGEAAVQLFLRDITDRQNAREALMQAKAEAEVERQRLHDLFMQAPACIAMLRGPNHVFELANPQYMDLVGPTRKVLGRSVREAFPEVVEQGFIELLNHVYQTGTPYSGQEKMVRFDADLQRTSTTVYLNFVYQPSHDADGRVDGVLVHAVDVTDQVLARQELVASEDKFRQLADSMPQMVWTADANGTVDYQNKQWYEYAGLPPGSSTPTAWYSKIHPDDRERTAQSWKVALETGTPLQSEYRMQDPRHPGRYRWFLGRAVPVKDESGKITRWFGTSTDITDVRRTTQRKKELERFTAALTEQRAQLVALNQAKDEFISLASHQLRTPATGVKQYIGMALEGFAGDITPEQRLFLERAYESNERQIAIINDLLQVAKVDAGKVSLILSKTDLIALIKNVVLEHAAHFADREQTIIFKPRLKVLEVPADPERLRMVLDNLIDNASKYTPHGKTIEIKVTRSGGKARIAIADQGVGIEPGDIDKIFRKFSRLDNALSAHVGGSGLGLYWAQKIVALHHGSITVDSAPGVGSTFTVTLPL